MQYVNVTTFNSSATYTCHTGTWIGPSVNTQPHSVKENHDNIFIAVGCTNDLPLHANAKFDVTATTFNSNATYTCHTGTWVEPGVSTQISQCKMEPDNRCKAFWSPVSNCKGMYLWFDQHI